MKKLFLVFVNGVVLVSIVMAVYHFYLVELDNEIIVDCTYEYEVSSNSVLISCDIDDEDLIISDDYPLSLYLYDENDLVVFEQNLESGINNIEIDDLDNNVLYSISVDGYNFITEEYTYTNFSEHNFSTASVDVVIPNYIFTENHISDTEYHFLVEIVDLGECATSVDITLYDDSSDLILTENYTNFDNLDFLFTDLVPSSDYYVDVEINYIINDYNQLSKILFPNEFTTLDILTSPSAELLNVYNDNVNLSFDLIMIDNDATEVLYTIELIDFEDIILYSDVTINSNIVLDVDEISGNYYISIKVSYLLNGIEYTNVELVTYNVYSDELSNFFIIPTVRIVDTELPLTSYDDYASYIFTFLNSGVSEFSIECEAPIDCSELVLNDSYSYIPFEITDLVHAYNDINSISYSYTSTEMNFTVGREYSNADIILVDTEVNNILNEIITESMTEYEKILAVHDYVVNVTVYDTICFEDGSLCDNDHTAIGVFFDELAVCEGYAHAIDIMLRTLQIPTFKMNSDTHQWNAVYYEGAWYHLDATWDDPTTHNGTNILDHTFFLITTAELEAEDSSESHDFATEFVDFME